MPANDFRCLVCGYHAEYQATRATAPSHCGQTMEWAPTRAPAVDAREPFQQFTTNVNGVDVNIGSLRQMRQIEAHTEKQARNGEGQRMVWRDWSQDRSNGDVHTLAKRLDRSMDTQNGFEHGATGVDTKRVGVARGEAVRARHEGTGVI